MKLCLARAAVTLLLSLLTSIALTGRARAADGGETFTETAADLKRLTGFPVQLHAGPFMADSRALPIICRQIVLAFQDAVVDWKTREQAGRLVHVVLIKEITDPKGHNHVDLHNGELTILARVPPTSAEPLRPLIAGVLDKALHVKPVPKP